MSFSEKPSEYLFHTKEKATKFVKALKARGDVRLSGKPSVRKTKSTTSKGITSTPYTYSAHFKGIGLMDTSDAATLARDMEGFSTKGQKTTPKFRAWYKLRPDSTRTESAAPIREVMEQLLNK